VSIKFGILQYPLHYLFQKKARGKPGFMLSSDVNQFLVH